VASTAAATSSHEVRVYLANPGKENARIHVFEVSPGGGGSRHEQTIEVPAGTTVQLPSKGGSPQSSIVAVAESGTFVPVEASYSTSGAGFAVATGVPIPPRWVPKG
jgi:hypothetical protein